MKKILLLMLLFVSASVFAGNTRIEKIKGRTGVMQGHWIKETKN